MKIEERESATLLEGNDFTIHNELLVELLCLLRQFWKLIGDTPQVARENFHSLSATMKLCANTVEFIFHVNCSCRPLVTVGRALTNEPAVRHNFGVILPEDNLIAYASNKRDRNYFDVYAMNIATGKVERELPDGVMSPDRSVYWTVEPGTTTVLRKLDPISGKYV